MAGEWRDITFDQLGRIITGKTPPSSVPGYFGGDIPFVTPTDFDGRRVIDATGRCLTEQGGKVVSRSRIPCRAVMVSCIGSDMGKAAIAGRECVTNQQINSIVVESGDDPLFVYYNLSIRKAEIRAAASGSAQPILNKSGFGQFNIFLPPPREQRAIAHILGTLDDKIELNRRMNETLEAMARALFKSWFVDFDPVRAKCRGEPMCSPQFGQAPHSGQARRPAPTKWPQHILDLFPDRFVESELGEIPEGWEVRRVADVGNVICGKTPSTKALEYYGQDVPFITIPDMHEKIFVTKTQKQLSRAGAASQKKKMLPIGAICVSCIATSGLVVITTKEAQTNQQINTVVPNRTNETYFWFWSFHDLGDEIRAGGSGGSVLTNLSKGRFSEISILAPPTKLRRSYHSCVANLFSRILSNERQISTLTALRNTLLPKLISGVLRVDDAVKFIGRVS